MMHKLKALFIAVSMAICQFIVAQNIGVQVNMNLTPPYTLSLHDYTQPGSNKLQVTILLKDLNYPVYQARLRFTIEGNGFTLTTRPTYMPAPIDLQGGVPTILGATDLETYFLTENLDFNGLNKSDYLRTRKLPEGFYRFFVEVLDYNRGSLVSNKGMTMAYIVLNDPPIINLPANNTKLPANDPQNILFNWAPRHLGSPNSAFTTQYEFRLYEIQPKGRSPYEAVRTTPPVYEAVPPISTTSFNYNIAMPGLIPGNEYAFTIRAVDREGRDLFKNDGYSEVYKFTWGDECKSPTGIKAEAVSGGGIDLKWASAPAHTGYNIQYRTKGNGSWFTQNSFVDNTSVYELPGNSEIEYQVQSVCGGYQSDFSPISVIKTKEEEKRNFSCGAGSDISITNTNPKNSLNVGDQFTAGGFTAKVTKISGQDGTFSGECNVVVPFFNLAKIPHQFNNIKINELNLMYEGKLVSIYNPNSIFVARVGDGKNKAGENQQENLMGVKDTIVVETIVSVNKTSDGTILVISANGDTTSIHRNTDGSASVIHANGDTTKIAAGDPVVIADSNGKTAVIDSNGNVNTNGNTVASSAEGSVDNSLSDFYMVFTVKNISLNKMDFYYCSSKTSVDDKIIETLKTMYSTLLINAGGIEEPISELKRSECIVTDNEALEVRYCIEYRIIKSGDVYINSHSYKDNGATKKYNYKFLENGNPVTINSAKYNTLTIAEDKMITINVAKQGETDYKKALELRIVKLQPRAYVVTFDGKTYKNGDEIILVKGQQCVLKAMEKEPSANLKELSTQEIFWNKVKITESAEYKFTAENNLNNMIVKFTNDNKSIALSFTIKVEEPFVPGITINGDKTSEEYTFISNAQKQIKSKEPDFYNYLAKKNVTINIASNKDDLTAGEAGWNDLQPPQGFQFDPKTLHYEGNCICNPIIITKFVTSFDVQRLKNELNIGNIPKSDLYNQIKLANPDEIKEVEDLIIGNRLDGLIKTMFYMQSFKVYRSATDQEIATSVNDPLNGNITLYTDFLNDKTKSNKYTYLNPPAEDELKQDNYVRKLAHELMHLHYQANYKAEKAKWSIMRAKTENTVSKTKLCDDYTNNYGCKNCSKGAGHEKNNPEGQAACAEECKY